MKSEEGKLKTVVRVHHYSNHPVVQEKLAKANEMLDKADLSFLKKPAEKQQR